MGMDMDMDIDMDIDVDIDMDIGIDIDIYPHMQHTPGLPSHVCDDAVSTAHARGG